MKDKETIDSQTKKLSMIIDLLKDIPKYQWDKLVVEVNREYAKNASKVELTDVSAIKKLLGYNL